MATTAAAGASNPTQALYASLNAAREKADAKDISPQDRFLKLLVTQLRNQDPLNPMDNAQMTSQMAQINTVTGIQQLNQTLKGMADQFSSLHRPSGLSVASTPVPEVNTNRRSPPACRQPSTIAAISSISRLRAMITSGVARSRRRKAPLASQVLTVIDARWSRRWA